MGIIQNLEAWAESHHPKWIDFVRIGLGIFIFTKGITFMSDTEGINELLEGSSFGQFVGLGVIHYVQMAHLAGGLLIAIGLITRVAIVFQIPILLGAVILNLPQGLGNLLETEISIIVLLLLVLFFVLGSGKLSADNYIGKGSDGR